MKGLPLAYNKDMQEDKEAVFDAVDTLDMCLTGVPAMLDTMNRPGQHAQGRRPRALSTPPTAPTT